jgi:diacylglycerol kinase (ATP)
LLKLNLLFIINPISGGKTKVNLPKLVDSYLDKNKFNATYCFTEYIGHASELADSAAQKDFEIIVAVGGDGTINEVATQVLKHRKILGIIPFGSGNGLARFLKIPLSVKKAINVINQNQIIKIDAALMNEKSFFNMAGMGFDAQISAAFVQNKSRGLQGYVKAFLNEMISYKAQEYEVYIDGNKFIQRAFAISIANSSQYGNNVYISPDSAINDGLLEVCIVKEFPKYKLPLLAYQMVRAQTNNSNLVEIFQGKHIEIKRISDGPVHIDGESLQLGKNIVIDICRNS